MRSTSSFSVNQKSFAISLISLNRQHVRRTKRSLERVQLLLGKVRNFKPFCLSHVEIGGFFYSFLRLAPAAVEDRIGSRDPRGQGSLDIVQSTDRQERELS